MTDNDLQRQTERRKILKEMIQKYFPDDDVGESTEGHTTSKIGITRKSDKGDHRVVVQASGPLMKDVNNHYEIVFNAGMKRLKNILDNPPLKNEYFQGKLYLDNVPINSSMERAVKFCRGEKI